MHACACPRSGRTCSRHREGRSQSCTFFQRAGIVSSCFRLFSVIATPAHWRDRDRSSTAAGTAPRTLTGLARPAAPARRRVAKVSCRRGWRTSICYSRWLDDEGRAEPSSRKAAPGDNLRTGPALSQLSVIAMQSGARGRQTRCAFKQLLEKSRANIADRGGPDPNYERPPAAAADNESKPAPPPPRRMGQSVYL